MGQQLLGSGRVRDVQRARRRLHRLHFSVEQILPGTKAAERCMSGLTRPNDEMKRRKEKGVMVQQIQFFILYLHLLLS